MIFIRAVVHERVAQLADLRQEVRALRHAPFPTGDDAHLRGEGVLAPICAVAEHLRERRPSLRVIVLSMHREPAYIRRAIELGARGYLLKRTSREEVLRALRLRGDGPDGGDEPSGAPVCRCNGVPKETVEAAITAGSRTIADVGRETRAGTGCGGCRSKIAALLEDRLTQR
jgi:bacterioferritin-associated ferredoxin